ncbi:growth-regulating factor 7-like isoform X3 [Canna indica]|uniref:Growth-regulating factor n=1 Tax=Canna indica TaxID=4628 RepID=A0AAQ3JUG6_9LILI|nr:growth-regulating factor 7-like isoform X3 [Canna indica]
MDFGGVVGVDVLVGASSEATGLFSSSMASSDTAFIRQRVAEAEEAEDHEMRCLKLARTESKMMAPRKVAPFFSPNSHPLFPDGEQMLSFSSASKQEAMMLTLDGTLPYYHHPSASTSTAPSHLRNAGLCSGVFDENMDRVLARIRGPFTPSQRLELERQALIYKCIVENVAIPPSLLISMGRSLGPAGFPPFSAGYFGSSTLGWGQGYSGGNDDPEPGRCRRTDGKKWRCSRDAVVDQKYCERHMNRGRHRSRKHVEGRTGRAAKVIPATAPSRSAPAVSSGGISSNVANSLHQTDSFQTTDCYPAQFDRMKMNEGNVNESAQDSEGLSIIGSLNSKRTINLFEVSKEHNPFEEASSQVELGNISMDSPLKPPAISFSNEISNVTSPKFYDQQIQHHHHQYWIDQWPTNQFDCSNISWSEVEEKQSDRTQLSISIPTSCSDFVSSSSPNGDEFISCPFKALQEYSAIDMDLGLGIPSEASKCQRGYIPIPWERESSTAGPLGEVLNNTSRITSEQCKNFLSSSIKFLTDGCDLTTWLEASPTGILQKASFRSVSSSTGSSPRADNHDNNGTMSNDILGSSFVNLPTTPS